MEDTGRGSGEKIQMKIIGANSSPVITTFD